MTRCVKRIEIGLSPCVQEANDINYTYFYIIYKKKFLDEPDWDIYYWATDKRTPPDRWIDSPLLEKLKVHARNEGKVVRKMPPL